MLNLEHHRTLVGSKCQLTSNPHIFVVNIIRNMRTPTFLELDTLSAVSSKHSDI